jgi:pyridoxamine 5'-phosphate oxidase
MNDKSNASGSQLTGLDEKAVDADPIKMFGGWFTAAKQSGLHMPEAMTLATATKDGRPSARMVLLKQFDERGFVFYTNYNSRKAQDLDDNPYAALVFHWGALDYQVRVEGIVTRTSDDESDAYFQTRPRESQLGALASPQSEVITSRVVLEKRLEELTEFYAGGPVKRPAHWGGYLLKPSQIEFWKGRVGRLHDRLLYEREPNGTWTIRRLAP